MATTIVFSDIDLSFVKHPITNDIGRKINDEAIKQSMKNLILTTYHERHFNSKLGSPVRALLFEPVTPMLATVLKKSIEQVLNNFEPRIDLQNVTVDLISDDSNVNVNIYYKILGMQALQTFNIILGRTR
jgi:phage baseplate assembly protein W